MILTISLFSSLIAAFFAAFIAHHLATKRMQKSDLLNFRRIAYSDFLGAASRLAVARRIGETSNEVKDLAILNDAKNRILIAGEPHVVEALTAFWQSGATLEREQEILAFSRLVSVIRESLGYKRNDILGLNISDTIFKLEPSPYSFRKSKK